MLTAAEEEALVTRAQSGDKRAVRELIDAHIPLIVSIASKYSRYGNDHDDLVQEAKLGMVIGIDKFDLGKGLRLSTYARFWIRAMVLDWVLVNKSLVKIGSTPTQKKLFSRLKAVKARLGITNDTLTQDDLKRLSEQLGESVEEIQSMDQRLSANGMVSLDTRISEDGNGATLISRLVDETSDMSILEERIDEEKRMAAVRRAMESLDARSRDIIVSRFLIDETLTLEDLSHRYGVTRERIRQIEEKALDDLRGSIPNKLSRRLGMRQLAVL